MFNMSVIEFICKYDNEGKVREALNEKLIKHIKNDLDIETLLDEIAVSIVDEMESMFECEEIEGAYLHQGYASNVRSDIVKAVQRLLKHKLMNKD